MSAITVPTGKRHPILAAYLAQLALHPVRTKALTTGSLVFLQEVLGAHLARVPVKRPSKHAPAYEHVAARARVDAKAVKMFLYGLLVSAPLGHVLVGALQRAFAGRTDSRAKLLQILASNLIVAPIQTIAYLTSMAVINGARTTGQIKNTIADGFLPVIRITWVTSPLTLILAQRFVPQDLWNPFFNLVQFVIGTFFSYRLKQLQVAAKRAKRAEDEADKS